jgi:cytochrome P450
MLQQFHGRGIFGCRIGAASIANAPGAAAARATIVHRDLLCWPRRSAVARKSARGRPNVEDPHLTQDSIPRIIGAAFAPEAFRQEVVTSAFLGRRLMVVSRPGAVHHILLRNAENYVRPDAAFRVLSPPIGDGLFLAEGAEWRRERKLLAPAFAARAVPRLAVHAVRHGERMLAGLRAGQLERSPLFETLRDLTVAIAAEAFFGIDIAPYADELRALSSSYTDRLARGDLLDFLLPLWLPSPRDWARRRFRRRWLALIGRIVAERRRAGEAGSLFAQLDASETPRGIFVQQVATLLITGSETTGAALFWSVYLCAGAPGVQARVAEEARAAGITEENAAEALERLPYTRAVVSEAMRLYPPALSIVRRALTADVADGVAIARDAIVQVAPWVLHRHRLLWERPDQFDPERFLPQAPAPERYSYIPFGLGPRVCIGMQFALAEATLVLAMLLREFAVAPTTDRAVTPVAQITLQPSDPAPFRLARR